MSDDVWLALIATIIPAIGAIGSIVAMIYAKGAKQNSGQVDTKVEQLHKDVNGQLENLIATTGREQHAAGLLEGRTERDG